MNRNNIHKIQIFANRNTGFMFIQNKNKQVCLYSSQPDGGLKHISVPAQNRLLTPPDYSIGCSAPLKPGPRTLSTIGGRRYGGARKAGSLRQMNNWCDAVNESAEMFFLN